MKTHKDTAARARTKLAYSGNAVLRQRVWSDVLRNHNATLRQSVPGVRTARTIGGGAQSCSLPPSRHWFAGLSCWPDTRFAEATRAGRPFHNAASEGHFGGLVGHNDMLNAAGQIANCFATGSVRKVGLKELWLLDWRPG